MSTCVHSLMFLIAVPVDTLVGTVLTAIDTYTRWRFTMLRQGVSYKNQ